MHASMSLWVALENVGLNNETLGLENCEREFWIISWQVPRWHEAKHGMRRDALQQM